MLAKHRLVLAGMYVPACMHLLGAGALTDDKLAAMSATPMAADVAHLQPSPLFPAGSPAGIYACCGWRGSPVQPASMHAAN
jgi:hypothetical protein